jgi:hypothetical protein
MVISVLERRAEIGLRRSLGATRGRIRLQFLSESLLLSALGGIGGVVIGIAVTTLYATTQSWPTVVPAWATVGGLAATLPGSARSPVCTGHSCGAARTYRGAGHHMTRPIPSGGTPRALPTAAERGGDHAHSVPRA